MVLEDGVKNMKLILKIINKRPMFTISSPDLNLY